MNVLCRLRGHVFRSHVSLIWLTRAGVELALYTCKRCGKTEVGN